MEGTVVVYVFSGGKVLVMIEVASSVSVRILEALLGKRSSEVGVEVSCF